MVEEDDSLLAQRPKLDGIPCGNSTFCSPPLNEVCVGGRRCACRPGEDRATPEDKCVKVRRVPLSLRVIRNASETLVFSSRYGNRENIPYQKLESVFKKDLHKALESLGFSEDVVANDVVLMTHPKTVNRLG